MRFCDLHLRSEILHAVADLGFRYCTPVQAQALPSALAGKDVAGRAQTGTGKTAAFLIAMLQRFLQHPLPHGAAPGTPRALIIAPTRELAIQIKKDADALGRYSGCRTLAVYGGMDHRKQQNALRLETVDILVATPGRLLDFRQSHSVHLQKVEILVIDEADRMLDMGFIPDVRRIIHSLPPRQQRQTMLFSATLTPDVLRLASQWMREPVMVEIEPENVAVATVEQIVYLVGSRQKFALLHHLLTHPPAQRVLVFGNRRDSTLHLAEHLQRYGINCALLSGDVEQQKRLQILEDFRTGRIPVLIATDVAGRGLHVEGISHVINYDIPYEPEDYVHRIGRTGRAGATGVACTLACENESFELPAIEKYIGRPLRCVVPDEAWLKLPPPPAGAQRRHEHAIGLLPPGRHPRAHPHGSPRRYSSRRPRR
jgi:ATP-dependent RNA helicase RhlB